MLPWYLYYHRRATLVNVPPSCRQQPGPEHWQSHSAPCRPSGRAADTSGHTGSSQALTRGSSQALVALLLELQRPDVLRPPGPPRPLARGGGRVVARGRAVVTSHSVLASVVVQLLFLEHSPIYFNLPQFIKWFNCTSCGRSNCVHNLFVPSISRQHGDSKQWLYS